MVSWNDYGRSFVFEHSFYDFMAVYCAGAEGQRSIHKTVELAPSRTAWFAIKFKSHVS
jgi:hypothetical protein